MKFCQKVKACKVNKENKEHQEPLQGFDIIR